MAQKNSPPALLHEHQHPSCPNHVSELGIGQPSLLHVPINPEWTVPAAFLRDVASLNIPYHHMKSKALYFQSQSPQFDGAVHTVCISNSNFTFGLQLPKSLYFSQIRFATILASSMDESIKLLHIGYCYNWSPHHFDEWIRLRHFQIIHCIKQFLHIQRGSLCISQSK